VGTTSPRGRLEFESGDARRDPDGSGVQSAVLDAELRTDLARLRLVVGWVLVMHCSGFIGDLVVRVGIQHVSAVGTVAVRAIGAVFLLSIFALLRRRSITARQFAWLRATTFVGFTVALAAQCALDRGISTGLFISLIPILIFQATSVPMPLRAGLPRIVGTALLGIVLVLAVTIATPSIAAIAGDVDALARFGTISMVSLVSAVLLAVGGDAYWRLRRQVFAWRLVGRYRLVERIGRGGMGEVWRAAHPGLRRDVAVKILRGDRATAEQIARFEAEIAALSELSHPNTVRVYDSGVTDDGLCYYAMELLQGETLDARVRRAGRLDPVAAAMVIRQIARALAEAHDRGIVHRDLTPSNVFLDTSAGRERAKLIDFGIAKRTNTPHTSDTGTAVIGTPAYMAPEVAAGAQATPASDVWGLGAVWYFALMGVSPPRELAATVAQLDPLAVSCLAADPARRPPGMRTIESGLAQRRSLPAEVPAIADDPLPTTSASIPMVTDSVEDYDHEHRASYVRLRTVLRAGLVLWCALMVCDLALGSCTGSLGVGPLFAVRTLSLIAFGACMWKIDQRIPSPRTLAIVRALAFAVLAIACGVSATLDLGPMSAFCSTMAFVLVAQGLAMPGRVRPTLRALLATAAIYVVVLGLGMLVRPQPAYDPEQYFPNLFALPVMAALMAIFGKAHWSLRQQLFEQRVVGRYKLQRMLGAGGMGEVWSSTHAGLGREVAIKLLRPDEASPERIARFEAEIAALTALQHAHTVRIFDCGTTDDGYWFYVMERLHGQTLTEAIETGGAFHGPRALHVAQQIAGALAEAHAAGIVHRDLKPDNVFLARIGADREHVKVIDFGIAKRVLESRLTRTGIAVGTPSFMSPEQAQCLDVDARSDVYALGALLFYMLTSRPPFTAESAAIVMMAHVRDDAPRPSQIALGLPAALDNLVVRCLAKEPADRPASMAALAAELEELARTYDQLAPAPAPITVTAATPPGSVAPVGDTPVL
jgi:serine/threonine-protein kinase